eukprot:3938380-Rhodomonas_salina.2
MEPQTYSAMASSSSRSTRSGRAHMSAYASMSNLNPLRPTPRLSTAESRVVVPQYLPVSVPRLPE